MFAAIDFGISNTDVGILDKGNMSFFSLKSRSSLVNTKDIKEIFTINNIDTSDIEVIGVTGGKSSDLEDSFEGIKIIKVNEIEAIGLGAKKLYDLEDESALIVSAGTGTACVHAEGNSFYHLGGIAVGGGMLEGLGSLLFKNSNGIEINEFGKKGSRVKLDLLIGDVVNQIGDLSSEVTAVNFGQARLINSVETIENTAAALCNMIGEVIGTVSYLNALLIGSEKACFIGRTSCLSEIINGIDQRLNLAGVQGYYQQNREYANVIGVLERIKKFK